ncbi:MAG: lasso peptide biosynthesis protein [Planctomycetia bacterium]|nr:lasso peptide biosynthesis protein [Planctomycetia bacterium]
MSRTAYCLITAGILAAVSLTAMLARRQVLGDEVKLPVDPGTWKVTLVVNGKCGGDGSRLLTSTPLDFGKQHVLQESCKSNELFAKPTDARHPSRRQVLWLPRGGCADVAFRAHYEFYCTVCMAEPTTNMTELAASLYAAPKPGQYLQSETDVPSDDAEIGELARRLTGGIEGKRDQAEALFRYVAEEIGNEPTVTGPGEEALDCLHSASGDSRSKSRLLAAMCRNRGIPARLVTGLALARGREQTAHVWVEAWVRDHWLPMCPFAQHFGRVPRTYLVFGFGDLNLARGRKLHNLDCAFLVERLAAGSAEPPAEPSLARRVFTFCSFHPLQPAEQRLVVFLLLLPPAALIVCLFRNVIGLGSFGTFAPALLGLSFRELHSLPGILVFVTILLTGWLLRRALDRYHLLQVPRMALMLSLVVLVLIGAVVLAAHHNLPATRYVALFPIVILVGMIERFWTLETEDGTTSSFRTLLATMFIATVIGLVLGLRAVETHLYRYPETLGLVMAVQLLIGRYTGYRLLELYRFRDFLQEPPEEEQPEVTNARNVAALKVRALESIRSPLNRA